MTIGTRVARFLRSLALLALLTVGAPWVLVAAARARFGGASPLHGVAGPGDWNWARIRGAVTDQLTEQTIADIVVRSCLTVAWLALAVLWVTVVAELLHMLRHDGLPMPAVRGLGLAQPLARAIAAGLLTLVPMLTTPARAVALDLRLTDTALASVELDPPQPPVRADAIARPDPTPHERAGPRSTPSSSEPAGLAGVDVRSYVVRPGDSIYSIAERFSGSADVAEFADRVLEANLGRTMPDGQRFTNAAYIDVGWVLDLPGPVPDAASTHVVERGETLWSIADDELGDPGRWPEIFEANRGRTFDDGRTLDDPDLIQPGWPLAVPSVEHPVDTPADRHGTTGGDEPAPASSPAAAATDEAPPVEPVPAVTGTGDHDARPGIDAPSGPVGPTDRPATVPAPAPRPPDRAVEPERAVGPEQPSLPAEPAGPVNTWGDRVGLAGQPDGRLLSVGRAAMLSAGALALLAVRRRRRLRSARPRARLPLVTPEAARTERELRSIDAGDRFVRVDIAVRAAASSLVDDAARVEAVLVADDGSLALVASGPVRLPAPWDPTDDPRRWQLAGSTPIELLADPSRRVGAPCPTLVQLGRTHDGRDLYVDLEALGAIEIGGPGDQADAIVAAIAATLAGSVLAEVTTLVGVGVDDRAFLGHRLHVSARDVRHAFECAAEAIGSTATCGGSTFELRARVTGGETWEPAVVLAGSAVGTVTAPTDRTGLAIVSAAPVHGPSSRLAPEGDAWVLQPLGVRFVPVGLTVDEVAALAALLGSADEELVVDEDALGDRSPTADPGPDDAARSPAPDPAFHGAPGTDVDDDLTLAPPVDAPLTADRHDDPVPVVSPPLLVRLLGPVSVESPDGTVATFERSKSLELVAWLATHRDRATRTAARTALWDLDVRDATFANVVSEARRSLARLVEPPAGEEWIARTLTESLPLHPLVRTDADLVRDALETARVQPPDLAIATLRPAAELVVGLPFEGTGYSWSDAEGISSQLVLLATTVAGELGAHCLSVGDVGGVFEATGRGLRVLPGHETLIGLRMQAHARAGDQAGVRHEWEQYERVVTADPWSDGEPSATLVELRRRLLAR